MLRPLPFPRRISIEINEQCDRIRRLRGRDRSSGLTVRDWKAGRRVER